MKRKKKEQTGGAAAAVQVRERGGHPFAALRGYMPLGGADAALYRSVREAVPIVDAAIGKLVRLSGGFRVLCEDERAQEELGEFLRTVNVGHAQVGFNAFLDKYLDSLLTNGRAVGEIVPDAEGREIAAVLCHRVEQLALREGETALDVRFCGYDAAGRLRELPRQELVLFTPLLPESENPYGVSLLRSMPFMAELLSRIYYAVGQNWERCGNVRFAVVYKPQGEEPDGALARERAELLAQEWSGAMQETRGGSVRDFVSVGDVSIRAIGADNVMPDCEVPVRQILEQLVAKTGLPPFLLGLSWSSTERMSSQQADMLTSEITALRRTLTPMVERVCRLWLRLHGYGFWMDRLRAMAQLYDSVRIDHFIGFANYYSVKAGEKTARNGKWVIGPGKAFFAAVKKKVPELKVVAEDLGAVNDRVRNLLAFCGYPGMKVLQFAYDGGGGDNSHQPQLYQPNCAAYTGTHDNDTSLGWWRACSDQTRRNLREALGEVDDSTVVWRMIKAVFDSRANIAMAPMQDFLGLDSAARMNTPGTVGEKNWRYRALSSDFSAELAACMRALCEESGRV